MSIIFVVFINIFLILISPVEAMPNEIKRLMYLFLEPEDLYTPVIKESFNFWEKNFSKSYTLEAKYEDSYTISILCSDPVGLPSGWGTKNKSHFNGKIKVEFFYQDNCILTDKITKEKAIFYKKNDMDHLRKIDLYFFNIPIQKKFKHHLSLKLTVIDPDSSLETYKNSLILVVGVAETK